MKLIIRSMLLGALVLSVYRTESSAFGIPRATPTPTPTASPEIRASPTPAQIQTLESLQSKIRGRVLSPEAVRSRVGIKIVSLATGKVVFENDADKYYMPASNMKNFTVAAALDTLGPDFKFVTSVYAAAPPDASGTLKGDLRIFGRGDVSFSTLFSTGNYYKGLDDLADKIVAAGVKRVESQLIADENYFSGNAIPVTWEWDDLQWSDGAEVSAFPINNNAVDLSVKGGTSEFEPCAVDILPTNTVFQIINTCTTVAGTKRTLSVKKALDTNKVLISGKMPARETFTGYLAVTHPAELFISMLKERLQKKGVVILGAASTRPTSTMPTASTLELARLESPPLGVIAAKTMKPSQNMFTEVILWTLGEAGSPAPDYGPLGQSRVDPRPDSAVLGVRRVKDFMAKAGIPPDAVVQWDGSGLSRHDLVTPSAVVQLYSYMAKSRNAQVWRDSLAVGGVDGTLRNRFKGTAADGNFRGKTGTLDQVSALSGYVTTAAGEELIVSIIVNTLPEPPKRVALIDSIVLQLANFNGKVDQ